MQYALVGRGWLAQIMGREDLVIPLRKMDIDRQDASVHLDISRDTLNDFPEYDNLDDPDLKQKVDQFWGIGQYERPMEGGTRYGRRPATETAEQQMQMEQPVPSTRKEEYVQVSSRPVVVEEIRMYRIPNEQGPMTEEERRDIERRQEEERKKGAA